MKTLIDGVLSFQDRTLPSYRETFAKLAKGQSPKALFITCSDSRLVPSLFTSSEPGDLFVVRNVGNLVPPCAEDSDVSSADESEIAAIEYAIEALGVESIVVCGHSECGAMKALLDNRKTIEVPNLSAWLRHGDKALEAFSARGEVVSLEPHNRLAQLNVIQQVEHLKSYPLVHKQLKAGKLAVDGWWFEIASGTVHRLDQSTQTFSPLME